MVTLSRVVRFCVNPPGRRADEGRDANGFAGLPALRGLGRFYEVEVTCRGEADPATGYLLNIKDIDRAARATVIPLITRACDGAAESDAGTLMPDLVAALDPALGGRLRSLRWRLTPYHCVEMVASDPGVVLLRQRFDFAASHRLHVPAMSDEENRALFGKCNNPRGHGHNYRVEPCVAVRLDGSTRVPFDLPALERIVEQAVIRRFDHRHLDEDVPDFRPGGPAATSSVENIARVVYDLLAPAIRREHPGAELRCVTVWETDRTSSTYPG